MPADAELARISLNMLRTRRARREDHLFERMPDPLVDREGGVDPEHEAILGKSVGLALFVVLETLAPTERVAFVLHDVFGVPFGEIAPIVERSPVATRQLASRARRRVRGASASVSLPGRIARPVVDAFVAAVRGGDIEALLEVLDPDVVLRADGGTRWAGATREIRGAQAVARSAVLVQRFLTGFDVRRALVNGALGIVTWDADGQLFSIMGFTVVGSRIVEIDVLADPERLRTLDVSAVWRDGVRT